MKLISILLTAILCASASAQTIRTLGYNSTNGQVVAATNVVWTNTTTFRKVVVDPQASGALGIQYGTNDSGLYNGGTYNILSLRVGGINALTAETNGVSFANPNTTRTNLSLGLPALTNTSNVTMMRALAGSTNTSHPFTGSVTVVDDVNDVATLVFSNGILVEFQ